MLCRTHKGGCCQARAALEGQRRPVFALPLDAPAEPFESLLGAQHLGAGGSGTPLWLPYPPDCCPALSSGGVGTLLKLCCCAAGASCRNTMMGLAGRGLLRCGCCRNWCCCSCCGGGTPCCCCCGFILLPALMGLLIGLHGSCMLPAGERVSSPALLLAGRVGPCGSRDTRRGQHATAQRNGSSTSGCTTHPNARPLPAATAISTPHVVLLLLLLIACVASARCCCVFHVPRVSTQRRNASTFAGPCLCACLLSSC